jgi:hypothetical protein
MGSKLEVYKILVFGEILAHSFNSSISSLVNRDYGNHAESTDDAQKGQARSYNLKLDKN